MRIARVNVYLSDELARAARLSGLNVSAITQDAVRSRLAGVETDRWLDRLAALPATDISHEHALEALADAPPASTGAGIHD
jgi:post-segregation antitoxin (ccd killing protein)